MGHLTTHVLDTAQGRPAARCKVELYALGDGRRLLKTLETNDDGRCDGPLLEGEALRAGVYELVFHAGAYFARAGLSLPDPPFLEQVVVRFGIAAPDQHYHVPLLLSPWSYTTYRGG
jgi:5-hydroxyisourate hydrolase